MSRGRGRIWPTAKPVQVECCCQTRKPELTQNHAASEGVIARDILSGTSLHKARTESAEGLIPTHEKTSFLWVRFTFPPCGDATDLVIAEYCVVYLAA